MAPRTCVDHATTLASALYTERCRWRGNCDADHDVQVRDFPPFCDVLVSLGPGVVSAAHSCILASSSPVLKEKLLKEKEQKGGEWSLLRLDLSDLLLPLLIHSSAIDDRRFLLESALDLAYLGQQQVKKPEADSERFLRFSLGIWTMQEGQQLVERHQSAQEKTKSPQQEEAKEPNKNDKPPVQMDISFCPKCNLLFISKDEFLTHRMMDCTRKFTCKTCSAMFTRVQGLMEHLAEVRHGETVCSVCSLSLSCSSDMSQHLDRHMASPAKPYFCHKCDSRFSNRNALQQHLPKHSEETPFVCQICSKGFKWKHALTSHLNVHSGKKKFLCQDCGFATSHSSVFRNHQRLHTGQTMKCPLPDCAFETVRKQNLVEHQLTHSKEKPHQCEVCGKAFSLVKNMRRHARQHDCKAKRHRCQVPDCKFTTLRSDKFVEHVRRHQDDNQRTAQQNQTQSRQQLPQLGTLLDTVNPPNKTLVASPDFTAPAEADAVACTGAMPNNILLTAAPSEVIFADVRLGPIGTMAGVSSERENS